LSMYEQIQNLSVCKQWNAKQLLFFASQDELTLLISDTGLYDQLLERLVTSKCLVPIDHFRTVHNGVIHRPGCTCYFDPPLKCRTKAFADMTACQFIVDHFTNLQSL